MTRASRILFIFCLAIFIGLILAANRQLSKMAELAKSRPAPRPSGTNVVKRPLVARPRATTSEVVAAPAAPVEAAPLTLAEILKLPAGIERRHALERMGFDLASRDPEAALKQLAALTQPADRTAFIRGMFEPIAKLAPETALRLAKQVSPTEDRRRALLTLASAWTGVELQFRSGPNPELDLGMALIEVTRKPELAALWAQEILTGKGRLELLGWAAHYLAMTDPKRAYSLADSLPEADRKALYLRVAGGWASTDPSGAWKWASETSDAAIRYELQASVLRHWAGQEPAVAASMLNQLPPGPIRDRALGDISMQWGESDTQAALNWIKTLPETKDRELAQNQLQQVAPVGIGVMLRMEDNIPVVGGLIPDGPASRQGGLSENDRIVGVMDENGQWLDAREMRLEELTKKIRGAPGTRIQLRVLPPGQSDVSAAKILEITRGQVVYKRG